MSQNMAQDNKWKVGSVGKALMVLECFDMKRSELSLAQISEMVGIPKSTAFNIVKTLLSAGYLRKAENSQNYLLGIKLFELGYYVRNTLPIISYAIPIMEEITRSTGEITYLSTANFDKLLVLEGVYPDRRFSNYTTGGKRLPMHCCSAGKMILSTLPDKLVREIISRGMEPSTPNTICTVDGMMTELEKIRAQGYSVDNEEETLGVRCVSLPVLSNSRRAVGAISISGSVRSLTDEKIEQALPLLEKAAQFLSRRSRDFPAIFFDEQY